MQFSHYCYHLCISTLYYSHNMKEWERQWNKKLSKPKFMFLCACFKIHLRDELFTWKFWQQQYQKHLNSIKHKLLKKIFLLLFVFNIKYTLFVNFSTVLRHFMFAHTVRQIYLHTHTYLFVDVCMCNQGIKKCWHKVKLF